MADISMCIKKDCPSSIVAIERRPSLTKLGRYGRSLTTKESENASTLFCTEKFRVLMSKEKHQEFIRFYRDLFAILVILAIMQWQDEVQAPKG